MKKLLLIAMAAMTSFVAMAETKTYTDELVVTINGVSTDPQETTVNVEYRENGNINFSLKNFNLGGEINVGNIVVEDLPVVHGRRFDSFLFKGEINITPGDIEGVAEEDYLGPVLSPIPLKLAGKVSDEKLYVSIDIDMMDTALEQIIYVSFGTDFPEVPVVSTQQYTDDLIITINGESTEPQETTVTVETLETGDINFVLKNFNLMGEINVGNIVVEELILGEGHGYDTFSFKGNLDITPGDIEGVAEAEYLGPIISPIPLTLNGKMNDDKLYVNIDIDMMSTLGRIIHVSFGTDIPATYTVTYVIDGETLSTEQVEEGGTVSLPEAPEKEGYTFSGWTGVPDQVTDDVTITGSYTVNTYTVTYVVDGETVFSTEVAYGEAIPTYDYTPESDDRYTRTFEGWDGEHYDTMPAHDVTYTAIVSVIDAINKVGADADAKNIYDLSGRRIQRITKAGIYVVNGKRVVLK
ncbi:MAG: InlB B-repeat-containing protein [Bacteroidaceae bacterium]|nr:InlB B-repeat-containing protein [Bacteroidaceae bacterium]